MKKPSGETGEQLYEEKQKRLQPLIGKTYEIMDRTEKIKADLELIEKDEEKKLSEEEIKRMSQVKVYDSEGHDIGLLEPGESFTVKSIECLHQEDFNEHDPEYLLQINTERFGEKGYITSFDVTDIAGCCEEVDSSK